MNSIPYISESRVRELLDWDKTFAAMECALKSVANDRAFQNGRFVTQLADTTSNLMAVMPGYLSDNKYGALGCKIFTLFPNNSKRGEPVFKGNIFFMDEETGDLKAVIAAAEITEWRTAAASAVATKFLHGQNNNILAVLGAGAQGKAHAIAFQHFFNFREVRIWNRTPERARNLVNELNQEKNPKIFKACDNVEECVKGADVIVTATAGNQTYVKFDWLEKGVHINAIRVNPFNNEVDDATYKSSSVYIDYWKGAENELGGLERLGVEFKCQIGDLIAGLVPLPDPEAITVFQSLGMAVEDCAMARMVYDLHMANSS